MQFVLSLLGIKKIWLYVAIGAIALATVTGIYFVWKHNVEQQALLRFNQQQLEQTVRDQKEFRRRQEAIEEHQRQSARELADENRRLRTRVQGIQDMLNSPETVAGDRPASDILKRTVEQLRSQR